MNDYDIDGMDEPCQPIGCDNGYHLPGCPYAVVDDESEPRHGYYSWSPEERGEYDRMYGR